MNRYMNRLFSQGGRCCGGDRKSPASRNRSMNKQRLRHDGEYYECDRFEGRHHGLGWDYKCPSWNSAPVFGWLRKQVGRRWDDVYSEAVAALRGKSRSRDILSCIEDRVCTKIVVVDGAVCDADASYGGYRPLTTSGGYGPEFYVDGDGILCDAPRVPTWKSQNRGDSGVRLSVVWEGRTYVIRRGQLYRRTTVKLDTPAYAYAYPVLGNPRYEKVYEKHTYRQAGKVEKRRFFEACKEVGITLGDSRPWDTDTQ